jgi:hypothetical protein
MNLVRNVGLSEISTAPCLYSLALHIDPKTIRQLRSEKKFGNSETIHIFDMLNNIDGTQKSVLLTIFPRESVVNPITRPPLVLFSTRGILFLILTVMGKSMPAPQVALSEKMYYAMLGLMSGIVHRDAGDEGNLWDVKEHLLPKAFAKYFTSDDYAREPFKEIEFNQYTCTLRNLGELERFVMEYGDIVMQEWEQRIGSVDGTPRSTVNSH